MNSTSPYASYVNTIRKSVGSMIWNCHYVRQELPNVAISSDAEAHLLEILDDLEGALYDIRCELRNLEDELGLRPYHPPRHPNIFNPDPRITIELIREPLSDKMPALEFIEQRLREESDSQGKALACLLVSESANNLREDHQAISHALDHLMSNLRQMN